MAQPNVYDVLRERDFIAQVTHEDEVREYLSNEGAMFYVGFDPTADSLHAGHLVQVMVMRHMQRAGHTPIALMGGGTGYIGDPSGRTDLRSVLTPDGIRHNVACFEAQIQRLLGDGDLIMVDNADWIVPLNYIDYIRDIGPYFTVNRMLAAECYKLRMEAGLTFLEFNYMTLQAYDFLELFRRYGCRLQIGGDDQWSNIIAGADLIRRKEQEPAFGLTFRLLTTSQGHKMGKTSSGALWLDETKTSVYDFYQYWRNIEDASVGTCLRMMTLLDMDEIRRYEQLEGAAINEAKERLALEVTSFVHGREKAEQAAAAAKAVFGTGGDDDAVPTEVIDADEIGATFIDILANHRLTGSKGEARRLIKQGGFYVNDEPVEELFTELSEDMFVDGAVLIRLGKKRYYKLVKA
ncbi:MAG: tyrosine--tRNA ligase [Saccharofermentanales bacterium]|jgi:tyrosyl-tRNA synthetase